MSRVLFGWELGGGHGHVRPLLPIARALKAAGHEPVFAVRNVAGVWPLLRNEGFPVLSAPFWHDGRHRLARDWAGARTYADILSLHGWSEPDELEGMIRAWDALLDRVRPSLVVVEHAPGLCLATWKRIPSAQVGTGFTMPPPGMSTYPVLEESAKEIVPGERLLASVAEVQRRLGRAAPDSLPATLGHTRNFLTFFRELDPYSPVRAGAPIGPVVPPQGPVPLPSAPRWFAYLAADYARASEILLDLATTGIGGEAFSPGTPPGVRARLKDAGVVLHDTPARMEEVFPRVTAVVHAGGAGLASSSIAAGRPQLLLPQHLEQRLTARLLSRIGVAMSAGGEEPPASLLTRLVKGALYGMEAMDCAERIRKAGPWNALATIVDGLCATLSDFR